MIVYPKNWQQIGVPITIDDIDDALFQVIKDINSTNLSFSGGVDSSLLLHYLIETKGKAECFTVANNSKHPDIVYSKKSIKWFEDKYKIHIDHTVIIRPSIEGNELVKSFYCALRPLIKDIITGDCIDELSCGYYDHLDLKEETYYSILQKLKLEHLEPLNQNSDNIKVYLPYAEDRIANLFYRIPLYQKVNTTGRKLVIMNIAKGKVSPEIIERKKYGFATNYVY